jgi:hypothetical protein
MFRIGIDFDNTIACYDQAFVEVAALLGIHSVQKCSTKFEVKHQIQSLTDGDTEWQRLQGQVYGKHMLRAKAFAGVHEFVYLANMRGHEVFVVSHKSEFGHFDLERVPLRDQALRWLEENSFFDDSRCYLKKKNVFFESTRQDKIHRIQELGCTHFIDDLIEVFEEPEFPAGMNKVLFSPSGSNHVAGSTAAESWRDVTARILGPWSEAEVGQALQHLFPDLGISRASIQPGRGNSRIYKLSSSDSKDYLLKVYPDLQIDKRPRLHTEFSACQKLTELRYPVNQAIACNEHLGWGIYGWLEGLPIGDADVSFVDDAIDLSSRLQSDSHKSLAFSEFPLASEACLSGSDITKQIYARIHKLTAVVNPDLVAFIKDDFRSVLEVAVFRAKSLCGDLFDTPLARSFQMASPSDFGSHNALRLTCGTSMFYDFEYFGWDDPVKLVSDFHWHPGMYLGNELRKKWLVAAEFNFQNDPYFSVRLNSYLPLYGLRWCLIILNEFLKSEMARRLNANPGKNISNPDSCSLQLHKAKALLQEIKEKIHYGSTVQTTQA